MGLTNPFSITYAGTTVGGASSFQLVNAYTLDKTFEALRLVFDVRVDAGSIEQLQSRSEALEDAFRARLADGETLVISLGSASWTYRQGTSILNATASIAKSGNPDTDFGVSRLYTVTIEGGLPADGTGDGGLRDIEVLAEVTPSNQHVVTMRGVYTATTSGDALALYQSAFDGVATNYLQAVKSSATWELRDESYSLDRHGAASSPSPNLCSFFRQYVELLSFQASSTVDDPQVKDHRFVFTDRSQYPGDSEDGTTRLRRVIGTFDCAVDVDETTDVRGLFESKIRPLVESEFRNEFSPSVFAIEELSAAFDFTSNRLATSFAFVYQASGDSALVEVSTSVAYRETRTLDVTPVRDGNELSADVDVGWGTLERVWTRTAVAVGEDAPRRRLFGSDGGGPAGRLDQSVAGIVGPDARDPQTVRRSGWNVIASTSQATPKFLGETAGALRLTVLSETVVERYHDAPGGRTSSLIP